MEHVKPEWEPLEPPPSPTKWATFKVMLYKHLKVAMKRKRLLSNVYLAFMYSGLAAVTYHGLNKMAESFESIESQEGHESQELSSLRTSMLVILVPLFLLLAAQGTLQSAIVEIVGEKESKMKIIQEIYGLTTTMYWLSWMGYFAIVSCASISVAYIMLTLVVPVFSNSSPLIVLLIFFAGYVQQLEFAAIVSIFVDRQQTASILAGLVNLVLMSSFAALQAWLKGKSRATWLVASLLPTVNVGNSFSTVLWHEALYSCNDECTRGLNFRSIFQEELCATPYSPSEPCQDPTVIFPAGYSLMMMLASVLIYFVLAWWLEQVWQGEFGQAKALSFCLRPAYWASWCKETSRRCVEDAPPTLCLRKLHKAFGEQVAVDSIDLDVRKGEVFALLGHNGAGKTTCLNCVVGLTSVTSGGVTVNGYDISTQLTEARRQMAICPQDNPLYDVFTVREHLYFFACLRGVDRDFDGMICQLLAELGIEEKVDDLCTTLSGGQKRRLWVATALLGETPLLFLDEPTSGMDPASRRKLWRLLLQAKSVGRAVLFTTHYLEEADALADRKAVLSRGRIQACGTSHDLKMQFGVGYHFEVEFGGSPSPNQLQLLSRLVQEHVAGAKLEMGRSLAQKVSYSLPFHQISKFGPLLLEVDRHKPILGFDAYSMSMTSLEEVFMLLGEQAEQEEAGARCGEDVDEDEASESDTDSDAEIHVVEQSEFRSMQAMACLRLLLIIGDRRTAINALLVPAILLLYGLNQGAASFQLAFCSAAALTLPLSVFSAQILRDKSQKCKITAISQGLSVRAYWLGTLAGHYAVLSLIVAILIMAVQICGVPILDGPGFPLFCMQAALYPVGLLLYSYNVSLLFTTVEFALKVLPLLNVFLVFVPVGAVSLLWRLPGTSWQSAAKITHVLMSIFNPVYPLPGLIVTMTSEMPWFEYFRSWPGATLYGSILAWSVFGSLLLWRDARSYTARPGHLEDSADFSDLKDEDVLEEEAQVAAQDDGTEAVRYQSLYHTYRTRVNKEWKETPAVRGISLRVHRGECFGLLGPNGAGKTTTLGVLTGEIRPPSAGQVHIYGHDVTTEEGRVEAYKELGLCPQIDPIWENLSGREHLIFYGRVKGVPSKVLERRVEELLRRLGFSADDRSKAAGAYSGGMKRKLSLAIALLGRSSLLFLDEPSAAVDAVAKRHLWKVIRRRDRDQTVVMTTHSMEEAEALCDRLAIQVSGQLRCLGTPFHIKDKYGCGYQLEIFCHRPTSESAWQMQAEALQAFVLSRISSKAKLLENHAGRFLFQLPPAGHEGLSLGQVFVAMQSSKQFLGISDYSLMQPSLEQVFVRFAKEQEEATQDGQMQEREDIFQRSASSASSSSDSGASR